MLFQQRNKKKKRGISLVEVLVGMSILAIAMISMARGFVYFTKRNVDTQERAFATQKAIQMMEELRSLIANQSETSIGVLDGYDDGSAYNPVLTTRPEVTNPADPLSGNTRGMFTRRISVVRVANDPLVRQVYVRVYRTEGLQGSERNEPLAETASVLRTLRNNFVSSQVYDVYILSLENVPGWWVSPSSMKPMMDNVIQDLQIRNPGLEWRTHWITRLAYGRDPHYRPFINETTKTNTTAPSQVYFYPGLMDKPGLGDFFYYIPNFIKSRLNVDGTHVNDDSYSLADQYNHGVRYPDEVALYQQDVAQALAEDRTPPEISLRMLFEKMNSSPDELRNALIINLHGELVPLPPMRNYSDAAKEPQGNPNVRIVTHPERIQFNSGNEVRLRVYPYVTNPAGWTPDSTFAETTLFFPTVRLTATDIDIRKLEGNNSVVYQWADAVSGTDFTLSNPTTFQTLITLRNSPIRHPPNSARGLPTSDWLYGLEYIPSLVSDNDKFREGERDLTTPTSSRPKNTARWMVRIDTGSLADGQYPVETRLGTDLTTGSSTNEPTNLSRTYIWIGEAPPFTEQFQYMGDPRHMPYSDVKVNEGYNWYFRSFDTNDYPGWNQAQDGWSNNINVDLPRYYQALREGIMTSGSLWTGMTGWTFYYFGLGGEMGYDSNNGFPNGLPIVESPWNPGSTSVADVDEITSDQSTSHPRLISRFDDSWWSVYWTGELYRDVDYPTWVANGNLPTGAGNFYRDHYDDSTKGFSYRPQKRAFGQGCASFFNGNDSGANNEYFNHDSINSNVAVITATGTVMARDFNFPLLTQMVAKRPFRLDHTDTGLQPPEWNQAPYTTLRTTLSTLEEAYEAQGRESTHDSSAIIRVERGTSAGSLVVNGLSPQVDFGAAQISKLCALNLVRGFMASGESGVTVARIPQLPLIHISSPVVADKFVNPSNISVAWSHSWRRWDTEKYTSSYSDTHTESTPLTVNVKYSDDNGKNWFYIQNNIPTKPGEKNDVYNLSSPYSWDVSSFGDGNYIVRVEIHRRDINLHYAYHQRQIYIQKNVN